MKSNRLSALSEKERHAGRWTKIDELDIPDNTPVKVWLKDLEFPLLLVKQVFKNKDLSIGVRFLVSNDFDLSEDDVMTLYKKRCRAARAECRRMPQGHKTKCSYREITDPYRHDPKQPHLWFDNDLCQTRKTKIHLEPEPLRHEN
jgi:hypothetical protein